MPKHSKKKNSDGPDEMHKTAKAKEKKNRLGPVDVIKPSFSLDEEQLANVKDWKTGKSYTLKVEVTEKSARLTRNKDGDKIVKARFEIDKVGVIEE